MLILRTVLLVLEVLSSFIIIGLVLIQKSKSEGLGLAFGSGMGESILGARAGNVLTKLTITFGIIFMANTLVLALVYAGGHEQSLMSREAPVAQPVPAAPMAAPVPVGQPSAPPTLPASPSDDITPAAQPATPAPASAPVSTGVPTLPGADLGDAPLTVEPEPEAAEETP